MFPETVVRCPCNSWREPIHLRVNDHPYDRFPTGPAPGEQGHIGLRPISTRPTRFPQTVGQGMAPGPLLAESDLTEEPIPFGDDLRRQLEGVVCRAVRGDGPRMPHATAHEDVSALRVDCRVGVTGSRVSGSGRVESTDQLQRSAQICSGVEPLTKSSAICPSLSTGGSAFFTQSLRWYASCRKWNNTSRASAEPMSCVLIGRPEQSRVGPSHSLVLIAPCFEQHATGA